MTQGAVSGVVTSTIVIFWIVIGAYVYKAPLPELPFSTSGCDEQAMAMFNTYLQNEIDLLNPKPVTDEYVQIAEDTNDW